MSISSNGIQGLAKIAKSHVEGWRETDCNTTSSLCVRVCIHTQRERERERERSILLQSLCVHVCVCLIMDSTDGVLSRAPVPPQLYVLGLFYGCHGRTLPEAAKRRLGWCIFMNSCHVLTIYVHTDRHTNHSGRRTVFSLHRWTEYTDRAREFSKEKSCQRGNSLLSERPSWLFLRLYPREICIKTDHHSMPALDTTYYRSYIRVQS